MAIPKTDWKTIARPGWFGETRAEKIAEYNRLYGEGNWRLRHQLGPRTLGFDEAMQLYELCYEFDFLNPDRRYVWNDLIKTAKDVWTESESDIDSGLDYTIQKSPAVHYEDISIRRILKNYGKKFKGNKLIRIRADSEDLVGKVLSSIHIPFLYPEYIEAPIDDNFEWWNRHKGSLESFWHFNKILQVKNY